MMGALRGMAAGLGEGLMASGRLFGEAALAEQRASLELEKTKALEQFRIEQARGERDRIGGIVASARTAAMDEGPVTTAMQDRSAVKALSESGYIDQAAALDKVYESGAKTTPWGSVTHDSAGNVIYDNASELKGSIQQQQSDAKKAAADAKNAPKPLTQEQFDRITTQIDRIVTNNLAGAKNPFAMAGEDAKSAADTAKQNLMSTALGKMAVNAAQSGVTMNPNEGFIQLKTVVDKFDAKVTADARAYAGKVFDEKGQLKEGAVQSLQNANVPDMALQDRASFMRWYRDSKLSDMDEFAKFRKGSAPAPSQQEAKPAEAKPAASQAPAPQRNEAKPEAPASAMDKVAGELDGKQRALSAARAELKQAETDWNYATGLVGRSRISDDARSKIDAKRRELSAKVATLESEVNALHKQGRTAELPKSARTTQLEQRYGF